MKKQFLMFSALLAMTAATAQAQTIYVPTPGTGTSTNSNVGIGTNAPEEKLTVNGGNIKINGATNGLQLGNAIKLFEDNGALKFKTSNTYTPKFVIYPSGNIGFAAGDWGHAINMNGNIAMGTAGNGILFAGNCNVSSFNNGLAITTYGTRRLTITDIGRIGIGTDAPTSTFEVKTSPDFNLATKIRVAASGTVLAHTNTVLSLYNDDLTPNNYVRMHFASKLSDNTDDNFTSIATQFRNRTVGQNEGDLVFATSYHGADTEKLRITAEGYVFIGTEGFLNGRKLLATDANAKLGVNGNIYASGLICKAVNNWPDYVFDSNYSLTPLNEVEQFIAANHHLPDVLSAAEVQEKGVNTVEMDKMLLKKVEELTLYVIQLQKEVEALKSK